MTPTTVDADAPSTNGPQPLLVRELVVYALVKLIDAAASTDLRSVERRSDRVVFKANRALDVFGALPRRMGVSLRALNGSSSEYIRALEREPGGPVSAWMQQFPVLQGDPVSRLKVLGLAAIHRYSDAFLNRRFAEEVELDALKRVRAASSGPGDQHLRSDDMWGSDPADVCRACLLALQRQTQADGLTRLDLEALALLGASLQVVASIGRCKVCFRWAEPGSRACKWHSSSERDCAPDGFRAKRIAKARQIFRHVFGTSGPNFRPIYGLEVGVGNWLTRIAWGTSDESEDAVVDQLLARIDALPHVRELLVASQGRLRRTSVVSLLMRHIDPWEVRPDAWSRHIDLAELWLAAEADGLPRSRGLTTRSLALVHEAIAIAERGVVGRSELAEELGRHPTLISHWMRRGAGHPVVEQLRMLLRTRALPELERPRPLEQETEEEPAISEQTKLRMLKRARRVAQAIARLRAQGIIDSPDYRPRPLHRAPAGRN